MFKDEDFSKSWEADLSVINSENEKDKIDESKIGKSTAGDSEGD